MDDASADTRDYLVFRLGQREYGIALDQVQELRRVDAVRITRDGAAITTGADPSGVIAGSIAYLSGSQGDDVDHAIDRLVNALHPFSIRLAA